MYIKNSAHLFSMVDQISIFFHYFTLEAFQCSNSDMSQPLWLDERVSDIYKSLAYHCERQASYLSTNLVAPSVESPLSARANIARPLTSKTVVLAYCTGYLVVARQLKRPLNQTTQGLLSAFCSSKATVIKFPMVYVLQDLVDSGFGFWLVVLVAVRCSSCELLES